MLGNKPLSEIKKELSERLKAAGIDEEQLRAQLRRLGPIKTKKPVTVASMLSQSDSTKVKKRRRVISKTR